MWQPEGSVQVQLPDLHAKLARAFAIYVADNCTAFAQMRECRRIMGSGYEIVSFDLRIAVPQRPVYSIKPIETISVGFHPENERAPQVVVTRPDFPDTPHQNIVPEGEPNVLCIDDRPWQDARADYAPSELMTRIIRWFDKACQGELHGADQPFDPVFAYSTRCQIILTKSAEAATEVGQPLDVWLADEKRRFLIVTAADPNVTGSQSGVGFQAIYADVKPEAMLRIRRTPGNLKRLIEVMGERGLDLLPLLQQAVLDWLESSRTSGDRISCFCILITLPQIHPLTGEIETAPPTAFLCDAASCDIGVALGLLSKNVSGAANSVGYVRLFAINPDWQALERIRVDVAALHHELDAARAGLLSGNEIPDKRRVAMIGAGSLGSSLAEVLVREGLYRWTIIDDDALLPHNVSRHTLTREDFGQPKVSRLAKRLSSIRIDAEPEPIQENVLHLGPENRAGKAIDDADFVIDASASVPVSRWLADRPGTPRVISAFFTPSGQSAVLMCESSDRRVTLRDVEAAYVREMLVNPALQDHHQAGQQMRYTGACRALTNRIPTSSVAILSGLIAGALPDAANASEASLKIWTMSHSGGIDCINVPVTTRRAAWEDWTILLPTSLVDELAAKREQALPNETGGPLMGLIDHEAKFISIVHTLSPPKDSAGTPTGFERGKRGLHRSIVEAQVRSGGLSRYIGEWHSHPAGHSAAPSSVDMKQIEELSVALEIDSLPAVSLIMGEGEIRLLIGEARHG
ncbi:ThiF family adenylyltransferase [Mangrovicella endophytica]|uniref:ThiF family adenylyltransferase n=1 Tax=Mangrovicella endophytica TaxID=2066697 RepID=UPI000C9EB66D|nr:ThiF family adenylyltransferase [Mangrovicella endophytica]